MGNNKKGFLAFYPNLISRYVYVTCPIPITSIDSTVIEGVKDHTIILYLMHILMHLKL